MGPRIIREISIKAIIVGLRISTPIFYSSKRGQSASRGIKEKKKVGFRVRKRRPGGGKRNDRARKLRVDFSIWKRVRKLTPDIKKYHFSSEERHFPGHSSVQIPRRVFVLFCQFAVNPRRKRRSLLTPGKK